MMGGLLSAAHSRSPARELWDHLGALRDALWLCLVHINGLTSSSVTGQKQKMEVSAPANATTNAFDMAAMASRAVREPWIVVQTTREVDILDDVYRWCKYRDCRWQTGMPWLLTSSSWAGCLRVLRKFRCK
ncbi:uncharacterized protein LOC112892334 isoform X5 [Panicum hallii]|uniref:uncharacterized protein LOC112892334 isoform X5 n=1 Tax=Panicum hallii TaxID=206008 RepID=UPI000DF4D09E|nr:uncharacterized protein LOC112892334 isoform X5 [Panicum hallii]